MHIYLVAQRNLITFTFSYIILLNLLKQLFEMIWFNY